MANELGFWIGLILLVLGLIIAFYPLAIYKGQPQDIYVLVFGWRTMIGLITSILGVFMGWFSR